MASRTSTRSREQRFESKAFDAICPSLLVNALYLLRCFKFCAISVLPAPTTRSVNQSNKHMFDR